MSIERATQTRMKANKHKESPKFLPSRGRHIGTLYTALPRGNQHRRKGQIYKNDMQRRNIQYLKERDS